MAPEVLQHLATGGGSFPVTKMQDPKEKFYRHFQDEVVILQEQIDGIGSIAQVGGERQDAIDHILAGISNLSNEVADASDFVPSYDQRNYAQAVKALTDKLNETTTKLAPRSRFQFKPRAANTVTSDLAAPKNDPRLLVGSSLADPLPASRGGPILAAAAATSPGVQVESDGLGELPSFPKNYNEEMARPSTTKVRKPSFSTAKDIAIFGQEGLHIILPSSASRATSSGRLTDLKGCVVDMSLTLSGTTSFANLALKNIDKSLIVAGNVTGPTHITGVSNSVIVVSARQVRIHECKNVDIYLHCSSHPIIEDCSNMRFAPLPASFHTPEDPGKNQWDQVDDFKWLKSEPSPNWSILPEEQRLADEIWTKVVPGERGKDLHDILEAVGVSKQ
ncbi:tubulin binding cofactor C [Colletotrichum graminicola]|uniref:Tubulin binding cofactor C n=1 Tax=Colletotrichum graminicola (strain M1.001 / M2 / FGSC 10212) TaxID=645133 RepID=E3Q908_COLGM|nr:tubulin binding cofactor C [Colletotrichum graminicola M1.001]EFQ27522.1 tubulin binding cofactor C [Colletotrichum graminicola M1.001]WDK13344.1 tubulin binding cofactor C [Colletotrichum graminicola]